MPRKLTTEEFIGKAIKVHGNRYDYSKVEYDRSDDKVIIICKKHKEFKQSPHSHLKGHGCKRCGDISNAKKNTISTEEFIKKAKKVHGSKYNYSKTICKGSKDKVIIICLEHSEFKQTIYAHLNGHGCYKCGRISASNKIRNTNEYFIEKAKKVHNNKYDYSKIEHKNSDTKVVIICKYHGSFLQRPGNHLMGQGCPSCRAEKITTEEFIEMAIKIHGKKYDYSKTIYRSKNKKVTIICKIHKEFEQTPSNHLMGRGCAKCGKINASNERRLTTKEFIKRSKKIHGNKYDYSKVIYTSIDKKVIIICKEHAEFEQIANGHLQGQGCPLCYYKNEAQVKQLLNQYFPQWEIIPQKKIWDEYKNYKHRRYCDFYLEKNNIRIIVEYDGELHFKPVQFNGMSIKQAKKNLKNYQIKDSLDAQFCLEHDIILYRIKYDEDKEQSIKNLRKIINE